MDNENENQEDRLKKPDSFRLFYIRNARLRRDLEIRRKKHYQDLHGDDWRYYALEDTKFDLELIGEYYYN